MKIFRALGLAIGIIVIKLLMPDVFAGLEHALVTFFDTASVVIGSGKEGIATGMPATAFIPQLPK